MEEVKKILNDALRELNLSIYDSFYEDVEGKKILNIVVDGEVLDLDNITKASRIINKIIDEKLQDDSYYELDIYGRSKEDDNNE